MPHLPRRLHGNGAGGLALNEAIDPLRTGDPAQFLERNTLHLFGLGTVQRLAEEMSAELQSIRDAAGRQACAVGAQVVARLETKGISFGEIHVRTGSGDTCTPAFDETNIEEIDPDLIIRAFGWQGTASTIQAFSRGAAHNEMGL